MTNICQDAYYQEEKRVSAMEDVKKRKFFCFVNGNISWYSHYRKQYKKFPQEITNQTII